MKDALSVNPDIVEMRAADAFAASRDCAYELRRDVIPNLGPHERRGAQHLVSRIDSQRIFDQEALNDLDAVIEAVKRRIDDGTTTVEQFTADVCHIDGGAVQTHRHRTADSEALVLALPFLLDLRDSIHEVFDVMHAIRAVDELRQRI